MISTPYKGRAVPVLYSAAVALILLRAYTEMIVIFILPVVLLTAAVFRYCAYCKEKNPRLYYAGLLAALLPILCLTIFSAYDVPLILWLFSPIPGDYTLFFLVVFIFGCFFIPSAVYYFTAVLYRAPILFLLLIIACVASYRRAAGVPSGYAALAAGLFFAVMAVSGNAELKDTVWRANGKWIYGFAGVVCAAAFLASFIRLPERDYPAAEAFGNVGASGLLGHSRYSAHPGGGDLSDQILFIVSADEPLYFIRQVFGAYDGARWEYPEDGSLNAGPYAWSDAAAYLHLDLLFDAFRVAGDWLVGQELLDGLEKFTNVERIRSATVTPQGIAAGYILAPARAFEVRGLPPGLSDIRNKMDEIFLADGKRTGAEYTVFYYRGFLGSHPAFQALTQTLDEDGWQALLLDMYYEADWPFQETVTSFLHQALNAGEYAAFVGEYRSKPIQALADTITAGRDGAYAKAKALEQYFHDSGFAYDLDYSPENDDIEYFLSEGKTGICGHYATAMTLMARMAGLNARYVEGFSATEVNSRGEYVIREKHSHAFVQVYIPLYGWATFDPTVAAEAPGAFRQMIHSIQKALEDHVFAIFASFSLLILLGFVGYLLYIRRIEDALFRHRVRKGGDGILPLYRRVLSLAEQRLHLENISAARLARTVYDAYGIPIEPITEPFERAVFGGETVTTEEVEAALAVYRRLRVRMRKLRPAAAVKTP